jgi:hypothetical protein
MSKCAHSASAPANYRGQVDEVLSDSSRAVNTARPLRVMTRSRQPQRRALLSTSATSLLPPDLSSMGQCITGDSECTSGGTHSEPHRCASDVDRLAPALAAVERFASPRNATSSSSCSARRSTCPVSVLGSGSSEHVLSFQPFLVSVCMHSLHQTPVNAARSNCDRAPTRVAVSLPHKPPVRRLQPGSSLQVCCRAEPRFLHQKAAPCPQVGGCGLTNTNPARLKAWAAARPLS